MSRPKVKKVHIKYTPYIFLTFVVLVLIAFFFIKFKVFLINQEKEYHEILYRLQQESFYQISNDIKKVFNILNLTKDKPDKINFLDSNLSLIYFKNIKIAKIEPIKQDFQVEAKNDVIRITIGFYSIYMDKNALLHLLSVSTPNYVNYQISINDQMIVTRGRKGSISNIKRTVINPECMINTELFIDEEYLLKNRWNWIYIQFLENILIITPLLLINWVYFLCYVREIIKKFKAIKSSYLNISAESTLLSNYIKTKNYYNELLISSVKQQIRSKKLDQIELLGDILYYPLLVDYKENITINNLSLSQEIRTLFEYKFYKKKIDFYNSNVDSEFIVDISKESFYQLIFSLLFNVINLLEKKACLELQFKVDGKKLHEIILIYSGFQLNIEQMVSYLNKKNCKDVFLLNMEQVITGLKLYGFFIKTHYTKNNKNIIQFTYQKIFIDNKVKNDNNIINLKDYLNK